MSCWVCVCEETDVIWLREVTALEGRKGVGEKVYKKGGRGNMVTTADLGGIFRQSQEKLPYKFERMAPTDAVKKVFQVLEGIYEPQGINVSEPIHSALVPTPMWVHQEMTDILAESAGE